MKLLSKMQKKEKTKYKVRKTKLGKNIESKDDIKIKNENNSKDSYETFENNNRPEEDLKWEQILKNAMENYEMDNWSQNQIQNQIQKK